MSLHIQKQNFPTKALLRVESLHVEYCVELVFSKKLKHAVEYPQVNQYTHILTFSQLKAVENMYDGKVSMPHFILQQSLRCESNNANVVLTLFWQSLNCSCPGLLHYQHQTHKCPAAKYHLSANTSWNYKPFQGPQSFTCSFVIADLHI